MIRYNSLGDHDGERGRLARCFGAPPKTYDRSNVCVSCARWNRVARGARHSGRGARAPQKLSQRFHSARRAITGSTRAARRAGSQQARNATPAISVAIEAKVIGSHAATP